MQACVNEHIIKSSFFEREFFYDKNSFFDHGDGKKQNKKGQVIFANIVRFKHPLADLGAIMSSR